QPVTRGTREFLGPSGADAVGFGTANTLDPRSFPWVGSTGTVAWNHWRVRPGPGAGALSDGARRCGHGRRPSDPLTPARGVRKRNTLGYPSGNGHRAPRVAVPGPTPLTPHDRRH